MVFHWGLSGSKSPQVSRTLLTILAVLNNAVVWMVSIRPFISKSTSSFTKPSLTVLKAPITTGSKVEVLILLFIFFQFYSVVSWDCKVKNFASSPVFFFFFFLFIDYYKVWSCG